MARTSSRTPGRNRIFFKRLLFVFVTADLVHGEPALRHNLLKGDTALRVPLEPFPRGGDCAAILLGQWFIIGIYHYFEELHNSGDLARAEWVKQLVGVL